jgi:hypothetical protein
MDYCEANYESLTGVKPKARLVIETDIKFGTGRNAENNTKYIRDPKNWKYDNSYRVDQVIFEPVEAPAGE